MRALVVVVALAGCDKLLSLQEVTAPPVFAQGETSLAAGAGHTCWIRGDGELYCWGENDDGQLGIAVTANENDAPARVGDATWLAIAAGDYHTCGIQSDGSLWCWGSDYYGEVGPGGNAGSYDRAPVAVPGTWAQVAAGITHTCAIATDGTLSCWGDDYWGQLGDGGTLVAGVAPTAVAGTWQRVCAGNGHTCAIAADGSLSCWGYNVAGELGDGTTVDKTRPVAAGTETWTDIACGRFHTCGQTSTGHVRCWGANASGELGTGDTTAQNSAVAVFVDGIDPDDWAGITVAGYHTCAWNHAGDAYCWGDSSHGELGVDGDVVNTKPVAIAGGPWKAVAPGEHHTCMIDDRDHLWCRGAASWGQLGTGGTSHAVPTLAAAAPAPAAAWLSVYAGAHDTCLVDDGNHASCAGANDDGELGLGNLTSHRTPATIAGAWNGLAVGDRYVCGYDDHYAVSCWGANYEGQSGLGQSPGRVSTPTQVAIPGSVDFMFDRIAAGDHTCARGLNAPYSMSCWGSDESGQIGDSTTSTTPEYTPSAGVTGAWEEVAIGFAFTCALDHPSHYPWCWGLNDHGQLGIGTTMTWNSPQQVNTGDAFTDLTAGYEHACAIDTNQVTWCWGYNGSGQLGGNDYADHSSPVQVAGGRSWKRIAAGRYHTCGITDVPDQDELWCWGDNRRGQLGNGDPTRAAVATPTRIGTDMDWQEVATGDWHTCAIRAGNVYCWGSNDDGMLADGTGWNPDAQLVPIP